MALIRHLTGRRSKVQSQPVRVLPPAVPVVDLDDLKAHVGLLPAEVDYDAILTRYEASAVANLDGWRGRLGRCIQRQAWRQEFSGCGMLRLALPDVIEAEASLIVAGVEHLTPLYLGADAVGSYVHVPGPQRCRLRVTYTCELPRDALPAVQQAVRMMVGHRFLYREGAPSPGVKTTFDSAIDDLIRPLRPVRI